MIGVHVIDKEAVSKRACREPDAGGVETQDTLGLIETPEGYVLVDAEGAHSNRPRRAEETFRFDFYEKMRWSEPDGRGRGKITVAVTPIAEGEITIAELLGMVEETVPIHLFVGSCGGHSELNFPVLLGTLRRLGVPEAELEEAVGRRADLDRREEMLKEG